MVLRSRLAGIVLALGIAMPAAHAERTHRTHTAAPHLACTSPAGTTRGTYTTGALEGTKVGGLYALYLGLPPGSSVPAKLHVDFDDRLKFLWHEKVRRAAHNPVVRATCEDLVATYGKDKQSMTIDAYIAEAEHAVREVNETIDWNAVGTHFHLGSRQRHLVRQLAARIHGRELLAYGMTELFPSDNGTLNVRMLDFLLRNAGENFIRAIPALYDDKTSFGQFQFTEYALYDANGVRRGASVIDGMLRKPLIPSSVSRLRGTQHFTAAYLNAIYNLALVMGKLSSPEQTTLERALVHEPRRIDDDVIQLVAVAHTGPKGAVEATRRWLDGGAHGDFSESTAGRYKQYAEKTRHNLAALGGFRHYGHRLYAARKNAHQR